jgi:DNA-binding transcriptional MocR family regulator
MTNVPERRGGQSITGGGAVEIARSVERALVRGALRQGDALPTVRALARQLGVSPATVAAAYRTLRQRGLLVAAGRRGTTVASRPPLAMRPAQPVPRGARDLMNGNPDPELLPPLGAVLGSFDPEQRLYGQERNLPELLELGRSQLRADGIPAGALAVASGALDAIERALAAHLRPGDRVALEDPAFPGVRDLVAAMGFVAVPVPMDDSGLLPEPLAAALARGAQALVVTPRAQNPTGAALDAARARALRRVIAAHASLLVIEDDHAGPVAGAPAQTLAQARRERWAVARSVSKSLGPDLRLAFLAGDAETIARVEGRQGVGMGWVSHVLQRLVAGLLRDRSTARLLVRAERTYAARREALVRALAAHGIRAHGRSGMNVWIPVPEETRVVQALLEDGWAVAAGERFRFASPPGIRVTIARLPVEDAPKLAGDVARALAERRLTASR